MCNRFFSKKWFTSGVPAGVSKKCPNMIFDGDSDLSIKKNLGGTPLWVWYAWLYFWDLPIWAEISDFKWKIVQKSIFQIFVKDTSKIKILSYLTYIITYYLNLSGSRLNGFGLSRSIFQHRIIKKSENRDFGTSQTYIFACSI